MYHTLRHCLSWHTVTQLTFIDTQIFSNAVSVGVEQWFLTLLEVLSATRSILAFIATLCFARFFFKLKTYVYSYILLLMQKLLSRSVASRIIRMGLIKPPDPGNGPPELLWLNRTQLKSHLYREKSLNSKNCRQRIGFTLRAAQFSNKSHNQDDGNKRHGSIINFSNYDISRIIKTLPRYATNPDVSDPNSRVSSSV